MRKKEIMLDFIVNPTAGGKHGKKTAKTVEKLTAILQEKGVDFAFHCTSEKGQGTTITKELIENGATDIIVVGGDGTLHEVINGFSNFENVNMGLIPCGTGNDFADALSISLDPEKALDLILNGTPKYVDFMQMPTVRGMNVIGMGIDVQVLKCYQSLKKKTKFGYTKCLLKTLFKFKALTFDGTYNGETKQYHSYIAAIANGHCFGGGIPLCPIADATDGKLHYIAVKQMSKLRLIYAFIKLKQGKVLKLKQTFHDTLSEIKIDKTKPYTVNVDGELYENIPFEVKVVSNTLKFYR